MAKFAFGLQSYLGIKEQIEGQKKNEYGLALRHLEEEKQRKRQLEQEVEDNILLFRKMLTVAIVSSEVSRYNNRIQSLKDWIVKQEERIQAAARDVEDKRLELTEAMKDRKTIETLKERRYEEYLKDLQRAEQTVVDGIVSYQYAEKGKV